MIYKNGKFFFSPSDLILYMESPFASWMEHSAALAPNSVPEPDPEDLMLSLLQKKGNMHELATLHQLKASGLTVVELIDSYAETQAAMAGGADVIYQARLEQLPFYGYADFLVKVKDGQSLLGDYHYEVWDTKLSHTMKPYFIIQLCCYAEMLESIQGRRPENIAVILGNNKKVILRTNDYFYYYLQLKQNFLSLHHNFTFANKPDPGDSSSWGRWSQHVKNIFVETDHLSQIANITSSQIKRLNKAGINTMEQLIHSDLSVDTMLNKEVLARLKAQATIQKNSVGKERPLYQVHVHEINKKSGLALLPPHSPLDLFFDLEGFPLIEGGLEYLWGSVYFGPDGKRQFTDLWAHNSQEELQAFKAFISWAYSRWVQDPTMHIYHYANYEVAACKRLMGRYGVCEFEVDQLLINEVFVDLYKIVKTGLLVGEPSYSIKNVEHLYRDLRNTAVGSGDGSVIFYDRWREVQDGSCWQTSEILNFIREYNIDDCNSTQELVDFLRQQQLINNIQYIGKTSVSEVTLSELITQRLQLRDALLAKAHELQVTSQEDVAVYKNLAWALEFHRREHKPLFWRLFDRLGMEEHELWEDLDCLANCIRVDKEPFKPSARSRNLAYEYKFDPNQEFKGMNDVYYILGVSTAAGKYFKVTLVKAHSNLQEGIIVVQAAEPPPDVISLVPDEYINPEPMPTALQRQAQACFEDRLSGAIVDFLKRSLPQITGHRSGSAIAPSQVPAIRIQQIISAVKNLNNSYLVIQGPPGAGKTYTATRLIAELLKEHKLIGICANSHKAINNLLISSAEYCKTLNLAATFICTKNTDVILESLGVKILDNSKLSGALNKSVVVGTTAWGFAREDLADQFDYLFIDEAGQVSIANLIAISRAAKNIILLGDQMQLGQPTQAMHPDESGKSILDYLLQGMPTVPEELGIFLDTSYRMHSKINNFISDCFYTGKLKIDEDNDRQKIRGSNDILRHEAGIIFVPTIHQGNTQSSDEEVVKIKELAHALLNREFTDRQGLERQITWNDMLFLAPFNYQVNKLRQALGKSIKAGSVDQFQGQEAPIVFLSMCASDVSGCPRGMNFLFDHKRLNVAISRAQCLAIVVANPNLSQFLASSVEQLALANIFCYLMKYAYCE